MRLNTDKIRMSMIKNKGLCEWSGLHCRAVYYLEDGGETREISMFSMEVSELARWHDEMIEKLKSDESIYQTLTI